LQNKNLVNMIPFIMRKCGWL